MFDTNELDAQFICDMTKYAGEDVIITGSLTGTLSIMLKHDTDRKFGYANNSWVHNNDALNVVEEYSPIDIGDLSI